jgi:hypothetical protein
MFSKSPEERLTIWKNFRDSIEVSDDPLLELIEFWRNAPYVPYNNKVDPYHQHSWPTPWEIVIHNKYDDFTKALMIAWTLKYTEKFDKSSIQVRSLVDKNQNAQYNVVCVDDKWILNYNEDVPVTVENIPDGFNIENIVLIERPK